MAYDSISLLATSNFLMSICGKFRFLAQQNIVSDGGTIAPGGSGIITTGLVNYQLAATIGGSVGVIQGFTYQNDELKNAVQLNIFFLEDTTYQKNKGDFTFNYITGTINISPNKFVGGDHLVVFYSKYVNVSNVISAPINTIITFENVDSYDLAWTQELVGKYGSGADFSVEILGDDGIYRVTTVGITPNDINNTTSYHFDFGGTSSGRIIF